MPRPEKVQSVQEIAGRFREAEAALLTEYRGLHVSDIAEVRTALREADADYKVLKNTLARIAVREVGLDELVGMLEGPTAIAFCNGDAVAAAKALDDAARRFPVLVIKGGVLQGRVIGSEQAQSLAKLESREIQLAKIVMMVNTPLQQMINVLAAPLRDLGSMLAQVLTKKEAGELEAGPSPESATEPASVEGAETAPPAAEGGADRMSPDAAPDEAPGPEVEATTEAPPEAEATASAQDADAEGSDAPASDGGRTAEGDSEPAPGVESAEGKDTQGSVGTEEE
jgi:large subunit ribosomal protein L10